MQHKVIVFPRGANPYQDLLYDNMSEVQHKYFTPNSRFTLGFIGMMPYTFFALLIYRLRGYRIMHLHWFYSFYVNGRIPFNQHIAYWQIRIFAWILKVLKIRVVWTVHNAVPQQSKTTNDLQLMRIFSKLASAKIAHSRSAVDQMEEYGLNTDNTTVIPHGSYIGVYKDNISRDAARKKLGIKKDEFVMLFFGHIKHYKGVEDLLAVYKKLNNNKSRLLIAGSCGDPELRPKILRAKKNLRIDFWDGMVADEDVAMFYKACDVVCAPFKAITTSGSVMLALSFGAPVIAPRLGALADIPKDAGYFYDPNDPDALLKTMSRAMKSSKKELEHKKEVAYKYAQELSWPEIAEKTAKIYQRLSNDHR